MTEYKTAYVIHLTTDMGTGCALCSRCDCNLNFGDPMALLPLYCPKCNSLLIDRGGAPYPFGGSDF